MKREREVRRKFLHSGHGSHYESLRRFKRGRSTSLYEACAQLSKGKKVSEITCHDDEVQTVLHGLRAPLAGNPVLLSLLRVICQESAEIMLFHPSIRKAIVTVSTYSQKFVRRSHDWKAPKGNFRQRFRHLLRHLFCHYPVPDFMDQVWLNTVSAQHEFYIDLGRGQRIYGHKFLRNAVLSRKMAHWYRYAPANASLIQAVRWAQIRSLRRDKYLYRAVANSFLGRTLNQDEFWAEVVTWLARQVITHHRWVRPVLRYISYLKFGRFQVGRVNMPFDAPEPNFKVAGRTFVSVLKSMLAFERALKLNLYQESANWMPVPLPAREWPRTQLPSGETADLHLVQLVRNQDLVWEGIQQKHCVSSYSDYCIEGSSSIWSLRQKQANGEKPLITIEVGTASRSIIEVKGYENRLPNEFETQLLREWAEEVGLSISEYAF
ncbi:MAG: PcfJ domain-containing protein [Bacteroidota bacterium]